MSDRKSRVLYTKDATTESLKKLLDTELAALDDDPNVVAIQGFDVKFNYRNWTVFVNYFENGGDWDD